MNNSAPSGFSSHLHTRVAIIFTCLVAVLTGLVLYYWTQKMEPELRSDAQSNAHFQSQALATMLGATLSTDTVTIPFEQVIRVLDGMLLFTHPSTEQPYIRRIELVIDVDVAEIPESSANISRGESSCGSCFISEVPVYTTPNRELIAIARFFINDEFFHKLRIDTRRHLIQTVGFAMGMLVLSWWIVNLLLRPLIVVARNVRARDITQLSTLPPLAAGTSAEIRMVKDALDDLLEKSRVYTQSLQDSRTELQQQAEERTHLIEQLETKNAELERFTYSVSHDLKSPLITIQGFIGMLRGDLETQATERIEQDLQQIASAADIMYQLLDDLLELSRIGRIANPSEWVNLGELVEKALQLIAGRIEQNRVQVVVGPNPPKVFGDHQRLLEVMLNLIDNAAKFVVPDRQPRIKISFEETTTQVICRVQDNGIGIEPRYQDKIFGLFERLDSNSDGTGIGLTLTKRIIEVHGGRIGLESGGKGLGCQFHFSIPKPNTEST